MEIVPYHSSMREQIIQIWEKSVRATHHFVTEEDIVFFSSIVKNIDFENIPVFCARENTALLGFIGIVEQKIEMLFVAPLAMGRGVGTGLLLYAFTYCDAWFVDVNEQNIKAVEFYIKHGFSIYDRSDTDDTGKPYPLLHMKRSLSE